ncbi:MAG: phage terminase large subunit family protein [Candidatus Coatesbacteria bacterium]|nr:MAG: phage terminase large subunit family protein [Candidatus Coatesbacteria bacterium]
MDLTEEELRMVVNGVLQRRFERSGVGGLAGFARRYIKLRGGRFSFADHAYLKAIYDDSAERTVFMKAAQVGLSTYHLIKAIRLADEGYKTVYFLPTGDQARAFARERFKPLLENSGLAGRVAGPADRITFADGAVLFHGLRSEAGVRSVDADFIVMDELDVSPADRVVLATDRILHSELGWVSYLSTPTYPGIGVSRLFDESDRRHWLVRCVGCGFDFDPDDHFPDCIGEVGGTVSRICARCGRPFYPEAGRWVAAHPSEKALRGYHVSHLATALPAAEILRQYREAERPFELRRFYNSVLGVPYHDPSGGLSAEELNGCIGDYAPAQVADGAVMGVDTGDTIYAVVALPEQTRLKVVYACEADHFEELDGLMGRFGAAACVVDAMPYKASASDFARRFPGRVWIAYLGAQRYYVDVERQAAGAVQRVGLDRSSAFDETVTAVRRREVSFPRRDDPAVDRLLEHLGNIYRVVEETTTGYRAVWKSAGPDHYACALLFALTATRLAPASGGLPAVAGKRRVGREVEG